MTRHCVSVPCEAGTLLYQTLTGQLVLIEGEADFAASRGALIRDRFLVPEDFDENEYADSIRWLHRTLWKGKGAKTRFMILTTTDCNAHCYYCFEHGKRRYTMTEKTARDVAEYIFRASKGKPVKLDWFGGEPLYNSERIDIICAMLREKGAVYRSTMISNGYYLRGDVLKRATELWNLESVQITLDGMKETYNRVKAYSDEDPDPYETVLRNIAESADAGVQVAIRLNVGAGNAEELLSLCDELAERFGGKERIIAYSSLLGDFNGHVGGFEDAEQEARQYLAIKRRLRELGLSEERIPKNRTQTNCCKADNDGCEIILPDGGIAKCNINYEESRIGSIYSDELDENQVKSWKEETRRPECSDCPMYPRCYSLKKCPWVGVSCLDGVQKIRVESLRDEMLTAYRKMGGSLRFKEKENQPVECEEQKGEEV